MLGARQKGPVATKDFLLRYESLDFRSRHSPLCRDMGFRLLWVAVSQRGDASSRRGSQVGWEGWVAIESGRFSITTESSLS